ncbi:MAG: RDD family protein [Opitutus sp.]|nr:RDD family protein [Opitutus sp.]
MFIIIGGDGKEYGPVTTEQVRTWIGAGRANLDTQAKEPGSDEWRRLGDYAEFAPPGSVPPSLPPQADDDVSRPFELPEPELAHRGVRTVAALLNAFVYLVCTIPGSIAMSRKLIEQNPDLAKGIIPRIEDLDLTALAEGVMWVWAGLLGAMFVQAILIALRGQNLGKLVFGGRVVSAADGEPVGFGRGVLLRFFLPVAIVVMLNIAFPLGCVFLLIDYCFMFREDQRCLHDLIAGTKVVRS